MGSEFYDGIRIANEFRIAEHLTSPYCLASGHVRTPCAAVSLRDVNGRVMAELLALDMDRGNRIACFSPDGTTLYHGAEQLHAMDISTGRSRRVDGIPQEPPFNTFHGMQCSPDNSTLVFTETAVPVFVRGRAPVSRYRLCRASVSGSGVRVLYEDPPDYRLLTTTCCWKGGFALFLRMSELKTREPYELWRVDLESGHLDLAGRFADAPWQISIHPDGEQAAWASDEDGIDVCSLGSGAKTKLLSSGTCPAWSPDGNTLAFMNGQDCLSLYDVQSGRSRTVVWCEPAASASGVGRSEYAVRPQWSPDGRMLWFTLTQTFKLPLPRNLADAFREVKWYIDPVVHNLNPRRTSGRCRSRRVSYRHLTGILDLPCKQVMLSAGYAYGVTWLPTRAPSTAETNATV